MRPLFFVVVERSIDTPFATSVFEFISGVGRHKGAVLVCIKDGNVSTQAVGGFPTSDPIDQNIVNRAFVNGGIPLDKDAKLVIQKEISLACCGKLQESLKVTFEDYVDAMNKGTIAYGYFAHELAPTETCSFQCIGGVCPKPPPQTESEVKNGVKDGKLFVNCRTQVNDYLAIADKIANAEECKLIPPPLPPSECGTITWWCRKDIVNPAINPAMWWDGGNFNEVSDLPAGCNHKPPGKVCVPPVSMENSPCSSVYDVISGQWKNASYILNDSVTMNCSEQ